MFLFRHWKSNSADATEPESKSNNGSTNGLDQINSKGVTTLVDTQLIAIDSCHNAEQRVRGGDSGSVILSPLSNLIAVNDTVDGFSDVAVRPLTYAEAARLAGANDEDTYNNDSETLVAGDVFDQYPAYDNESEGDDDLYNDLYADYNDDGPHLDDSLCSSLTPSPSLNSPQTPSLNVVSELQYGDQAQGFIRTMKFEKLDSRRSKKVSKK